MNEQKERPSKATAAPMCKLCETRHWGRDPHAFAKQPVTKEERKAIAVKALTAPKKAKKKKPAHRRNSRPVVKATAEKREGSPEPSPEDSKPATQA